MFEYVSDVAFTPTVKRFQETKGSRKGYARMEEKAGWQSTVTDELANFIAERDSFYLGTANADGQPYIQHRGGKPGFLKVIDEKTLAFADFRGNRQYISDGNLKGQDRIALILVDYPNSARIKIFGRARLSDDPALIARLRDDGYRARVERAVVITVEGFDWNCPQHLPVRLTIEELEPVLAPIRKELADLKAENAALKARLEK